MELLPKVTETILQADSKALATIGKSGINVVPVSTIRVVDGKIWLINYFFKKTLENILEQPAVALVCWKGFDGFQIRANVEYCDAGTQFEEARAWIGGILPDRIVKGLLILTPKEVYYISPTAG